MAKIGLFDVTTLRCGRSEKFYDIFIAIRIIELDQGITLGSTIC
jgi:hypothetical protein